MSQDGGIEPDVSLSTASISSSRLQPPSITRVFKQAADLFLKRNISESLNVLEPVVQKVEHGDGDGQESDRSDQDVAQAPIASASRTLRVKCWCLYIRIIDELIEVGADEGRRLFGASRWKELADSARLGSIWQTVVDIGYGGREFDVDAEVVANLATLLLAHMTSQKLTQERLETYLSATAPHPIDVASHMERSKPAPQSHANGTSTPRDLNSRLQIIELFVLHVLPRNDEWHFAKEFVVMSELLDEERKEAFIQALQALQDEKRLDEQREQQLQKQRQQQVEETHSTPIAAGSSQPSQEPHEDSRNQDIDYRADYGLSESPWKSESQNSRSNPKEVEKPGAAKASSRKKASEIRHPKVIPPSSISRRAYLMMAALQETVLGFGRSVRSNPAVLFRMLAFVIAFLMAIARQDIRDRLRRAKDMAWTKLRQTIGMGVKVSYV